MNKDTITRTRLDNYGRAIGFETVKADSFEIGQTVQFTTAVYFQGKTWFEGTVLERSEKGIEIEYSIRVGNGQTIKLARRNICNPKTQTA